MLEGEVMNGPYLIEMPASPSGLYRTQGTKVFAPDGTELTNILGVRVELEPNSIPVAYIKVPVHVGHR